MVTTSRSQLTESGQRIHGDRRPRNAPSVLRIDGRSIVWSPWVVADCIRRRTECPACHHHGQHWVAWGRVDPAPGEQFTEPRASRRGVREVTVPAWPIIRTVAYHCPACGHRTTYDMAGGGWLELTAAGAEQLELFPSPRKALP